MSDGLKTMKLSFFFLCAAALVACSDPAKPKTETETHFLRLCEGTCGASLSCICGVCTEACTDASACAKLNPAATCTPTPDACESAVASACELTCVQDAECEVLGAEYGCSDGYCRAAAEHGGAAGQGGAGGGGAAGSSGQAGQAGAGDPSAYDVRLEASDVTLCPGECVTLQATVANGVEPLRYAWSGVEVSADASEVEVCPIATATYEVTATDSRSTLGEFGGGDQEARASVELVVDPDCELPPDEVVPTCELRVPYMAAMNSFTGTTIVESQTQMATDARGNVFLVGSFQGTVDIGGIQATAEGLADAYILKLNPNCEPLWIETFGDASGTAGLSAVAITSDNEIYAVGVFEGTFDFGDGVAVTGEQESILVLKLDASGELIWRRHYTSAYRTVAFDVGVTDSGDVVFGGYTGPDADFGGGPIGGTPWSSTGVSYVARLDGDGEHRYSYAMDGGSSHLVLDVHGSGLVAISGSFGGIVEVAGETITYDPMIGERYVAVLDDAGALLRSMQLPFAEAPPGGRTYLIDTGGASVVFGSDQTMLFDQGCMRVEDGLGGTLPDPQRIVKLAADGTELWTVERAFLGADVVGFYGNLARDTQGNIIHADEISEDATVDDRAIAVAGEHDVYLEKLSPEGELLWSRTFGGPEIDRTWAVATDPQDAIWLAYVEAGGYAAASSVAVITKLAPDGRVTDAVDSVD